MNQFDFFRFINERDRSDLTFHDIQIGDLVVYWNAMTSCLEIDLVIGDIVRFTTEQGRTSVNFRSINQDGEKVARHYSDYHRTLAGIVRR